MSNYEKMKEYYKKTYDIESNVTPLVSALKDMVNEEIDKVRTDPTLSPEGRKLKTDEIMDKYGKQFIEQAKKMREEYDEAVIKAKARAEMILNEAPSKPNGVDDKTFERELNELKMDLLLSTNPQTSFEKVEQFVKAQDNAYNAFKLKQEMPELVKSVLSIADKNDESKLKTELRRTVDSLNNKVMTDEQREAQRIYDTIGDQYGKELFLPSGLQMNVIQQSVGEKYAKYANRPQDYKEEGEM